ncbi:hypothetical protein JCM8097_007047 [Rhodosporidiobolus ruineniae]
MAAVSTDVGQVGVGSSSRVAGEKPTRRPVLAPYPSPRPSPILASTSASIASPSPSYATSASSSSVALRRRSATVATVQGCEFEMFEPVPPAVPSPPNSPPRHLPLTSSPSRLSRFVFPAPSSTVSSSSSLDSIFRLDRPHALPDSYLDSRNSLTQAQVNSLTAELAAVLPSSWSQSGLSAASSPVKSGSGREESSGGGAGASESGETTLDPKEWARQRRLSMILSGLGMVLGSVSLSSGALLMQDEEPPSPSSPASPASPPPVELTTELEHRRKEEASPASARTYVSATSSSSGGLGAGEVFESADEGADGPSWPPSRRSSRSSGPARSRKNSVGTALTTIIVTSPLVPDVANVGGVDSLLHPSSNGVACSPEVAFGYACGSPAGEEEEVDAGAEADEDDDGPASSIAQLVRQSWRLSVTSDSPFRGVEGDGGVDGGRVRPIDRHDDGLGINLELLNFGGEDVGAAHGGEEEASGASTIRATSNAASSYMPSSRPLQPRASVLTAFQEINDAPVSDTVVAGVLPVSPPLVAGLATPAAPSSSTFSTTPSLSPLNTAIPTSHFYPLDSSTPSPSSPNPTSSTSNGRPIQPRTSSLAGSSTSLASSAADPQPHTRISRQPSTESGLNRRRSVISSSKSSKRLSALLTSGFDIVRSRTSSYNSNDGDDGEQFVRDRRRRSRTDGPISAPLPAAPFPPAPPIRRASTPPPVPTSTLSPSTAGPTPALGQSPLIGRTWRSTLTDDEYEQLTLMYGALEMRRQEVVWELCETERSFVNGLRGVIQVFTLPLRTRAGAWIKGVPVPVSRLLDWLDDIVHLHSQISAALDLAREKQYPVVLKIAEAVLPFVQRLEVHQPYLVRFESVTRSIDEMSADPASDFGEFVRMQSSLPECGALSLSSFLLKPVQRLMKYPLFFKQLCDLTPSGHPDHFPTLNLLHSTDSMIRVMQEVTTREDEYEEAKVLQSRIRDLPLGFQLAARDRRLVAHGVLRRVHINDRDRGVLEMDAMARAGRRGAALRGGAPLPPSLSIPVPVSVPPRTSSSLDAARPQSTVSDSGSSSVTYASDVSGSSGWTPPTTPGSALPASSPGFPHLRPDSMVSNASSAYSDDFASSAGGVAGSSSMFSSASARSQTAHQQRLVKTKAKESSVTVFVFSDLIVLAERDKDPGSFGGGSSKFMRTVKAGTGRKNSVAAEAERAPPTYRALESVGVARVLGVSDLSGKTEHDHLIEVDLLPILRGQDHFTPLSLSNTSLATSVYLTIPSASSSRSPVSPSLSNGDSAVFTERLRWLQAFERSYLFALRSLSFPPPSSASASSPSSASPLHSTRSNTPDRASVASFVQQGILPKSPSQQHLEKAHRQSAPPSQRSPEPDAVTLEREERAWWAVRLKKVRKELESGGTPAAAATSPGGPSAATPWAAGIVRPAYAAMNGRKPSAGTVKASSRNAAGGGNPGLGLGSLGIEGLGRGMGRRASG